MSTAREELEKIKLRAQMLDNIAKAMTEVSVLSANAQTLAIFREVLTAPMAKVKQRSEPSGFWRGSASRLFIAAFLGWSIGTAIAVTVAVVFSPPVCMCLGLGMVLSGAGMLGAIYSIS